jgi:hypothetical protein
MLFAWQKDAMSLRVLNGLRTNQLTRCGEDTIREENLLDFDLVDTRSNPRFGVKELLELWPCQ